MKGITKNEVIVNGKVGKCCGKLDAPLLSGLMELQSVDESNNLPQYANQNQ